MAAASQRARNIPFDGPNRTPLVTAEGADRNTQLAKPLLAMAAVFVLAGGYVHLREWLEVYRLVPAEATGSAVVRIGFPLNAVASLVVGAALGYCAAKRTRVVRHVVVAAVVLEIGSLGALILTRTGSLLGWAEPVWTVGADQSRAVEIGALVSLLAVATVVFFQRQTDERPPVVALPARRIPT